MSVDGTPLQKVTTLHKSTQSNEVAFHKINADVVSKLHVWVVSAIDNNLKYVAYLNREQIRTLMRDIGHSF